MELSQATDDFCPLLLFACYLSLACANVCATRNAMRHWNEFSKPSKSETVSKFNTLTTQASVSSLKGLGKFRKFSFGLAKSYSENQDSVWSGNGQGRENQWQFHNSHARAVYRIFWNHCRVFLKGGTPTFVLSVAVTLWKLLQGPDPTQSC